MSQLLWSTLLRLRVALVWGLVLALASCPRPLMAQQPESGFVPMFDGESLDGWQISTDEAKDAWSVLDGMIVGTGTKHRSYLIYARNRQITDFEMKFQYRFPGKGNSGVNIRARIDETGKRDYQAYHADLGQVGIGKQVLGAWDFHTPGRKEHRCFRGDRLVIDEHDQPQISSIENAVTVQDINKQDWNDVRIVVKGNHFRLSINGKLSSEFTEHLPAKKRLPAGEIQLQLHDPGMIVHFKNLRIKVLD